jgi:hypothetical protein
MRITADENNSFKDSQFWVDFVFCGDLVGLLVNGRATVSRCKAHFIERMQSTRVDVYDRSNKIALLRSFLSVFVTISPVSS